MEKKKIKIGPFLLLLTAMIWGFAFVAQSKAMDSIGPWTFNFTRSLLASIVLLCLMPLLRKITNWENVYSKKRTVIGGICTGILLTAGSMFQQVGIMYTTVGKAGFITTLYVVIVPIIGLLFHQKMPKKIFVSVILAVFGLYFLCMNESFRIGRGDTMVMLCALTFAFHILCVDYFTPRSDALMLSDIQFWTMTVICFFGMIFFEEPDMHAIQEAWVPIVYAGVLSSCAGYTMQILGQKDTEPTTASLLMSLESTFAAIGGWLILGQTLSARELAGCALTFGAVLIAELPVEKLFHRKREVSG